MKCPVPIIPLFNDLTRTLVLPPHHLIHYAHVALDDADDFGGDVFVDVVGYGDAGGPVADQGDGNVDTLQEADGVNAAQYEATFVQSLGALGGGADADSRERVVNQRYKRILFQAINASYSAIAPFIVSTIYLTSSSPTYGPAGRHMPTLKMASLMPLT